MSEHTERAEEHERPEPFTLPCDKHKGNGDEGEHDERMALRPVNTEENIHIQQQSDKGGECGSAEIDPHSTKRREWNDEMQKWLNQSRNQAVRTVTDGGLSILQYCTTNDMTNIDPDWWHVLGLSSQ